ncbi:MULTISPECIES: phosphotransferase [unclassified Crossiella]|uniref:phosphotransferase n=1 Tax=unclassified Crossiella TaxID=2620835 RepID=UPI001FFEF07F|nr:MULTISPECIES: phosphotransferase [unclassified Crossiella]MCK2238674.1 aminoglycoside phosphotransferase family protein [Crossiella sp. S99.2]MCK2251756.1 aminoglycoside phosphotransferase family protein [Crossiella sp. S99.1]
MKSRPSDLDDHTLHQALQAWNITATSLTHAPVGFGDHHWTATDQHTRRWFITVADLTAKPHCGPTPATAWHGLHQAMTTAATLPLDFIAAPVPTPDGDTLRRLGTRYALSVFPFLDGTAGHFGDPVNRPDRTAILTLLAHLHRTKPPATTPICPPALPSRATLTAALTTLHTPWTGGPFAEPARALTAQHATHLHHRLTEFDRRTATPHGTLVITHGEPHPGNLMRLENRHILLDWDTVGLAVPERDLWLVAQDDADLAHYTEISGRPVDRSTLELYRLRWALDDLSAFLHWFRSPHTRTADTEQAWTGFTETLSALTGTPGKATALEGIMATATTATTAAGDAITVSATAATDAVVTDPDPIATDPTAAP